MNWENRTETLKTIPKRYQNLFKQAYSGKSKAKAIKAFCIQCMGYSLKDAQNCTAIACPLHPYKPKKSKTPKNAQN